MQLTNRQTLPVSQAQAWDALNDVAVLQASIPGCDSLTAAGEDKYELVVQASVGPVKARFKGKLALQNMQPPSSYEIHFEGQGGAAGHGKGSAQVRLEAKGLSETELHYWVQASVGGKIAQIGQRLVDMAAQRMAAEFFSNFDARLRELHPSPTVAQPKSAPAQLSLWKRLREWLGRRLSRKTA